MGLSKVEPQNGPARPPGIKRIPKPDGTTWWYWVAAQLTRQSAGFRPRTQFLWCGQSEPEPGELAAIWSQCDRLTADLLDWLQHRQTRPRRPGLIYFIRGGEGIKIGFSVNPEVRRRELQVASASPLVVIGTIPGTPRMERRLHRQFHRLKMCGEWFRDEPVLQEFIAARGTTT